VAPPGDADIAAAPGLGTLCTTATALIATKAVARVSVSGLVDELGDPELPLLTAQSGAG